MTRSSGAGAPPNVTYAQVVLGTPGAGKSTYCHGMQQFLTAAGRPCIVVNLDPANRRTDYDCAVDIRDLIRIEDVMTRTAADANDDDVELGPNGALLFCIEFLEQNVEWLHNALAPYAGHWILFDLPGQVELYTVHRSLGAIIQRMSNDWGWRTVVVHLIDIAHCYDAARFISALLLSLTAMMQLELPHVNVLSKTDQIKQLGRLPLGLQFYTEVLDLSYLMELLQGGRPIPPRFQALSGAICDLIADFSLVKFVPLAIENRRSVLRLLNELDRATGYNVAMQHPAAGKPPAHEGTVPNTNSSA